MKNEDYRIRLLRSRLAYFREKEGLRTLGRPLSWMSIADHILEVTGVDLSDGRQAERLRQFIEGVWKNNKSGNRYLHKPILKDQEHIDAIEQFLREVHLLSDEEVYGPVEVPEIVYGHITFFGELDEHDLRFPEDKALIYREAQKSDIGTVVFELSISDSHRKDFSLVRLTVIFCSLPLKEIRERLRDLHLSDRHILKKVFFSGWAVHSANSAITAYLEDTYEGCRRTYLIDLFSRARHRAVVVSQLPRREGAAGWMYDSSRSSIAGGENDAVRSATFYEAES